MRKIFSHFVCLSETLIFMYRQIFLGQKKFKMDFLFKMPILVNKYIERPPHGTLENLLIWIKFQSWYIFKWCRNRGGGATAPPPIFGRSTNPIPTGEGRLSPPITTGTPNIFRLPYFSRTGITVFQTEKYISISILFHKYFGSIVKCQLLILKFEDNVICHHVLCVKIQ